MNPPKQHVNSKFSGARKYQKKTKKGVLKEYRTQYVSKINPTLLNISDIHIFCSIVYYGGN